MKTLAGDDPRGTCISMEVPERFLRYRRSMAIAALAAMVCVLGCAGGRHVQASSIAAEAQVHSGRRVIAEYKCGTCHTIPGIQGAHGVFGPPLNLMARRSFIAGNFANTPDNLAHWVMAPTSMKPKTAMPDLGLNRQQAQDVTAYLETLK